MKFLGLIIFIILMLIPKPTIMIVELKPIKLKLDKSPNKIIQETAQKVAENNKYKLHSFDCTDFSKELVGRLKHQNLNAYCIFGVLKNSDYPLHSWVEINLNGELPLNH